MSSAQTFFLVRKDDAWLEPVFGALAEAQKAAVDSGLDAERAVFAYLSDQRRFPKSMHPGWLAEMIRRRHIVAKADFKDGGWYTGKCRNSSLGQWDAKRIRPASQFHKETHGVFVYLREKFGLFLRNGSL